MSVDCDAKLTELAAGVLRDAVQVYDPASALNTVLFACNMTMLGGFDATGSFPAVTGSFPVLTGSFRAITGSFAAAGLDAAAEPAVTLKRVFKLPSRLPGIQLPSESELASVARSAPVIGVLAALASWLGQDGRPVTDAGDLADDDAADACGQLGIRPEQMSSLWAYALISGWLELEDSADRRQTWALTGPAARRWADGDDSGTLHGWAAVFAAVAGSVGPYGRLAAVDIARRVGAPGYRAWKDAVKRLELRGYARASLSMMASKLPKSTLRLVLEPDLDDMAWLATDRMALACGADDPDPDEIATGFAEVVPVGQHGRILGLMAHSSHPDVARVLDMLGTYHPDRRVAREARKAARARTRSRPAPS